MITFCNMVKQNPNPQVKKHAVANFKAGFMTYRDVVLYVGLCPVM